MKVSKALFQEATSKEAKRFARLQARLEKQFTEAALAHIKETEGRDLKAEVPNWTSYQVEVSSGRTGQVIVRQYLHDDRPPSKMLRQTWTIDKKKLVAS